MGRSSSRSDEAKCISYNGPDFLGAVSIKLSIKDGI